MSGDERTEGKGEARVSYLRNIREAIAKRDYIRANADWYSLMEKADNEAGISDSLMGRLIELGFEINEKGALHYLELAVKDRENVSGSDDYKSRMEALKRTFQNQSMCFYFVEEFQKMTEFAASLIESEHEIKGKIRESRELVENLQKVMIEDQEVLYGVS